jgi:hypothetical protein
MLKICLKLVIKRGVTMNRKASLNLSIQAIVIIVLAMTLLGLGLGFIKSQFASIQGLGDTVTSQVKEQIEGQLRTSGEKVSFPRELPFSKGKAQVLTLGIQNTGSRTLFFKIEMSWDTSDNSDFSKLGMDPSEFELRSDSSCKELSPGDILVEPIRANPAKTPGTFALRANVNSFEDAACATPSSSPIYASKLAFITVG